MSDADLSILHDSLANAFAEPPPRPDLFFDLPVGFQLKSARRPEFSIVDLWDRRRWLHFEREDEAYVLYDPRTGKRLSDSDDGSRYTIKSTAEHFAQTGCSLAMASQEAEIVAGAASEAANTVENAAFNSAAEMPAGAGAVLDVYDADAAAEEAATIAEVAATNAYFDVYEPVDMIASILSDLGGAAVPVASAYRPETAEEMEAAAAEAGAEAAAARRAVRGSALVLGPLDQDDCLCRILLGNALDDDGQPKDWAEHIMTELDTHADVAPSGSITLLLRVTHKDMQGLHKSLGFDAAKGVKQHAVKRGSADGEPPQLDFKYSGESYGMSHMSYARGTPTIRRVSATTILKLIYITDSDQARGLMREMNLKHAVVTHGNRLRIATKETDPITGATYMAYNTFQDFEHRYNNRTVKGMKDGAEVSLGKAGTWWTGHPHRRTYDGVIFDPRGRDYPGYLNLFQGFAIAPAAGDWSLMHDHIKTIVCDGDPDLLNYVLNWLARLFQYPDRLAETAIVLRGREGTGKGIFMQALRKIIGHQHSRQISQSRHLVGNFNAHLRDCVLLCADEAFYAGDKTGVGALKSLITEPTLEIEAKGVDSVTAPNMLHVIMASNEKWVVPAGPDARRYVVLDVADTQMQQATYFNALAAQMEAGGYAAMHYDLSHRNITGFRPQTVPVTKGLNDQRKLSLPTEFRWWADYLAQADAEDWPEWISTDTFFRSYKAFAKDAHEYRPLSAEDFGKHLRVIGGQEFRPRASKDEIAAMPGVPDRPRGYRFGNLNTARKAFENAAKTTVEWTEYAEDKN